MKIFLSAFLFICCATNLCAQDPNPIKPPPKVLILKAKVTPTAPKAGQQLCIDASAAKGDVLFDHDLPAGAAIIDGKKMYAAAPTIPQAKVYTVKIVYWDEKQTEKIVLNISGTDGPVVTPPEATPIQKLGVKVDALTKVVTDLAARVTALEGSKPPPPPPLTTKLAHVTFVGAEKTPEALAINNDADLRALLKTGSVGVYSIRANDPIIASKGLTATVAKAGGAPCVILQDADGNVINSAPMTSLAQVQNLCLANMKR